MERLDVPKLDLKFVDCHQQRQNDEYKGDRRGEEPENDEEEKELEKTGWRSWLTIVGPHAALVVATWAYTIFGASVFYHIEQPNEADQKNRSLRRINEIRSNFLDVLWNMTAADAANESLYAENAAREMDRVIEATFKAFEGGVTADDIASSNVSLTWTFFSAIFFSTTVITTIGYGNLVPVTLFGRLFCIGYALLGIPLTLITIADIGKFVSSFVIWLYETFSKIAACIFACVPSAFRYCTRTTTAATTTTAAEEANSAQTADDQSEVETRREAGDSGSNHSSVAESSEFEFEEEFEGMPVPQSFVLFTLLSYTAFGAVLFSQWEGWKFVDAFYFCLITMTTVGFGDLVPTEEAYLLLAIVFIFVGLVLATMCIDTVGSHYIRKIHYFGRKIQGANLGALGDFMKRMKKLQKEYGLTDEEMERMMLSPQEYVNFLQTHEQHKRGSRPYDPPEAAILKYIDQPPDPSPRGSNSTGQSSAKSSTRTVSSYDNMVNRRRIKMKA